MVSTAEIPQQGNLRTECDRLVISLWGDALDVASLHWVAYLRHTGCELRTGEISSEEIDGWLAELGEQRTSRSFLHRDGAG